MMSSKRRRTQVQHFEAAPVTGRRRKVEEEMDLEEDEADDVKMAEDDEEVEEEEDGEEEGEDEEVEEEEEEYDEEEEDDEYEELVDANGQPLSLRQRLELKISDILGPRGPGRPSRSRLMLEADTRAQLLESERTQRNRRGQSLSPLERSPEPIVYPIMRKSDIIAMNSSQPPSTPPQPELGLARPRRGGAGIAAAAAVDNAASLSPSGRPARLRTSSNRHLSPSTLQQQQHFRSARASSSRTPHDAAEESYANEEDGDESEQQQQQPRRSLKVTLGRNSNSFSLASRRQNQQLGGWLEEPIDGESAKRIYRNIVSKLRRYTDADGYKPAESLEDTPDPDEDPRYYKIVEKPTSLSAIWSRISASEYPTTEDFERDVLQLFENVRRYFRPGSDEYGSMLVLQRYYQHITRSIADVMRPEMDHEAQERNFASTKYGPAEEDETEGSGPAVASGGEKSKVDHILYKGQRIVVGDWVHLANPTDPARPIVAHIFATKTEQRADGRRQDWITACYYLRPEQTKHPRTMLFWTEEVFRTNQQVDHHVEDIIEHVFVMFYTRYLKARPAEGQSGWKKKSPLYVCESRWHAEKEMFFKIKNWHIVMPEEVRNRKIDMIEFPTPMSMQPKIKSPFLRDVQGPGSLQEDASKGLGHTSTASSSSLVEAAAAGVDLLFGGGDDVPQIFKGYTDELQRQRRRKRKEREAAASSKPETQEDGAKNNIPVQSQTPKVPPIAPAVDRTLQTVLLSAATSAAAPSSSSGQAQASPPSTSDLGYFKVLPAKTRDMFRLDPETGNVVWSAGLPSGHDPSELEERDELRRKRFSLDYLYWQATNGKAK